ncbi:MAG: glycosyltransferase [Salinivirgaceae bacterium]|jgi:glycosyltransferase involved in cell wall biosynthesis
MIEPYFSIIIPTFNRAHLIGKTIESIVNQEYNNFEVIVVDDGGLDNTKEVIENFNDSRIKYYWKENGERGVARNYGVTQSNGNYINFVDSDDLLYPFHLSQAAEIIEKLNLNVFCFNYDVKDNNGKLLKIGKNTESPLSKTLLKGNHLSMNAIFIERNILNSFKFNEDPHFISGEDWLLWLQLSVRYPFKFFNSITSTIVEHQQRSVHGFDERSYLYRTNLLITELKKDPVFCKKYLFGPIKIEAHMLSYTALHASLVGKRKTSLKYLYQAIRKNIFELFTKRALVILKNIIIKQHP